MKVFRRWLLILPIIASSWTTGLSQDASSFLAATDSVLSLEDTLNVVGLLDSLISLQSSSQLAIRLGYNSNVLSAGRTLGIQNFGLAPGVSYYHSSGLYADVSTFWSKDFNPSFYLTTVSLGYMHEFTKHFSAMADYDHYFYADQTYIPYQNTIGATPMLEFKPVTLLVNYSFYFGDQYAHRIMPGLNVRLQKKKIWKLDRISISPSFYALFGNETITEISFPTSWIELRRRYRKGLPLYDETETNVFGLMNYTFSAPFNVTVGHWSFTATYNYSVPKALKGEPLSISESSYLSGSITYFIDLKRNKLSL